MEGKIFDIAFTYADNNYIGWVNPSDKVNESGQPTSYHVVLNNTSFGYLSFKDCKWSVNEERPANLVKLVGEQIEKFYKL